MGLHNHLSSGLAHPGDTGNTPGPTEGSGAAWNPSRGEQGTVRDLKTRQALWFVASGLRPRDRERDGERPVSYLANGGPRMSCPC